MRAFIAIALPPELVATLGACRAALLDADPTWRREKWVADESLHMTLTFLGEVGADSLGRVAESLAGAVRDIPPFELAFTRLAAVPRLRAATLIWAESPDPDHAAARLAARVEDVVEQHVAISPAHPFRSHITLCRARRPRSIDPAVLAFASAPLGGAREPGRSMSVALVTLFTSTLTPSGPLYHEVMVAPLGG